MISIELDRVLDTPSTPSDAKLRQPWKYIFRYPTQNQGREIVFLHYRWLLDHGRQLMRLPHVSERQYQGQGNRERHRYLV